MTGPSRQRAACVQGNLAEAPRCERCQAIKENVIGPEHPDLAATLNSLAGLLASQVGID